MNILLKSIIIYFCIVISLILNSSCKSNKNSEPIVNTKQKYHNKRLKIVDRKIHDINQVLNELTIEEVNGLEILEINNCKLQVLDGLSRLINLKELDVTNNQLTELHIPEQCKNISKINIMGNPIKQIDYVNLKSHDNIRTLSVSYSDEDKRNDFLDNLLECKIPYLHIVSLKDKNYGFEITLNSKINTGLITNDSLEMRNFPSIKNSNILMKFKKHTQLEILGRAKLYTAEYISVNNKTVWIGTWLYCQFENTKGWILNNNDSIGYYNDEMIDMILSESTYLFDVDKIAVGDIVGDCTVILKEKVKDGWQVEFSCDKQIEILSSECGNFGCFVDVYKESNYRLPITRQSSMQFSFLVEYDDSRTDSDNNNFHHLLDDNNKYLISVKISKIKNYYGVGMCVFNSIDIKELLTYKIIGES